jgi:hypothetical protein
VLVDYKRLFAGIAASYACTVVTYHHDVVGIGPIPISAFFIPVDGDLRAQARELLASDMKRKVRGRDTPSKALLFDNDGKLIYRCHFNGAEIVDTP